MAGEESKAALRNTWETSAPGWAKWEKAFAAGLTRPTEVLLDQANIEPGMRVLDLACGAGDQTIQAANRVGPSGKVVACDISATMLHHVRQAAAEAGVANVETLECAADELDATQAPFDASISRLGLMLFPEPGNALKAVQRVLKPRARFAALVFTTPTDNPFMAQPMAILLRHAGKSPPARGRPGIFALGGDGILERLLIDSGLADVTTRRVSAALELPSASHALKMMQEAFGAYRAVVADLEDTERAAAWAEVSECLTQFEADGGFKTELEFVIGSGARPA